MMTGPLDDQHVLSAWQTNAEAWTGAIERQEIESRRLVTDQAILDTVLSYHPATALDVGCGEGWLTRALIQHGVRATGVDAIPDLIANARRLGPGDYHVLAYEDIATGKLTGVAFDVAVCNFSLIGKEAVDNLLRALPALLTPSGVLVIQTLHPLMATGDLPYRDGWRPGSWTGFGPQFSDPAPWYFRTLESWVRLLLGSGFRLLECREPIHPKTERPASLILVARKGG